MASDILRCMDDITEAPKAPRTTAQQLIELRTGRNVAEILEEMYGRDGKTEVRIARELGISRPTLRTWLAEFGIKRRDAA